MDEHGLRIDPARLGGERDRRLGGLRAHPDVDAVSPPMRGRVERLHRRVRQIGNLIDRLDQFRGRGEGRVNVAMAAAVGERPIERGAIFGAELVAVGRSGRAEIPHDRHRLERLLGAPEIVGDDRHAVGHRHGGDDPATAGDRGKIVGFELAAEHRAIGGGGVGHARQPGVDAEARRARDLERRVDALEARADKLELIGRLDRRLGRKRDLGGVCREFADRSPSARRPRRLTRPPLATHAAGATLHLAAAAAMSRARAEAPACCRNTREPRTDREPPVPID